MAVFYQTYRPKTFKEVVGQEAMIKALQNASKTGELGHAYLFTGGRGLGKTTLARILAKATNCGKVKDGDPCGKCETCLSIAQGNFLDVIEVDAASHTGVDNIRELIENINFQPSYGKTKVFIIDEVHMLSKAAFNALLKTLEEPPAHAMFILATTDIQKVPDTIISRTQRFDFRSITNDEIKKVLQKIVKTEGLSLPDGAIDLIVDNAEGGLRDALSQLGTIAVLPKSATLDDVHVLLGTTPENKISELLEIIAAGDKAQLPEFFDDLAVSNFDASSFAKRTLGVLQTILEQNLAGQSNEYNWQTPQILHLIRLFLRAHKEVDRALSPELPLLLASVEASLQFRNTTSIAPEVKTEIVLESELQSKKKVEKLEIAEELEVEQTPEPEVVILKRKEVEGWWPKVIDKVRESNSPLATLLKNSPIEDIDGNTVIVAVKYLFHKEHLESTKHRAMITETAGQIAGSPVAFRAIIKKTEEAEELPTEAVLSDAIQIFGGELVE